MTSDSVGKEYWLFSYKVGEVLHGAVAQRKGHEARVKWWEKKQKEVVKQIKSKGMDVRESIAAAYGNTSSSKFAPNAQIVIDPGLQQDLNECVGKVQHHKQRAKEYHAWVQTLEDRPREDTLDLTHEDWLYFFGE